MELMAAVRALHLGALAVLAGGFAFQPLVLRATAVPEGTRETLATWLARLRAWGAVLALLTWLAWLLPVAASMSGQPLGEAWQPSILKIVLAQTRFGHVWLIRFVLLLLLVGWIRGSASGLATTLVVCVLVSQAWAGHATVGPLSHVAVDAVHLVAAALWVGCLLPLLVVLARARAGDAAWLSLAARAAHGFTRMGLAVVVALAITGFINGQMMVGSVDALFTTPYGRLVLAKVALFVAMLVLAAVHRFRFAPQLGETQAAGAARRFWRSVAAELALGACIFAIVGALGGSEPVAHDRGMGMPMQHGAL